VLRQDGQTVVDEFGSRPSDNFRGPAAEGVIAILRGGTVFEDDLGQAVGVVAVAGAVRGAALVAFGQVAVRVVDVVVFCVGGEAVGGVVGMRRGELRRQSVADRIIGIRLG